MALKQYFFEGPLKQVHLVRFLFLHIDFTLIWIQFCQKKSNLMLPSCGINGKNKFITIREVTRLKVYGY